MAPFIGCSARAFIANVSLSNLEAIQNTQDTFTIIPIVCNLVSVESRGCCVRNPRRKQYATECMVLSFSPSLLHFICCECLVIMIIIYNHDPLVRSDQIIHWAKSSRLSSRVCILKSLSSCNLSFKNELGIKHPAYNTSAISSIPPFSCHKCLRIRAWHFGTQRLHQKFLRPSATSLLFLQEFEYV